MAGAITPLVGAGSDAFSNLYDVELIFPSKIIDPITKDKLSMSVRIVDFKPPELKPNTYQQEYKGISITKIGSKIEGAREFTISYRIDANYDLHTALQKWKHLYADPSGEGNIDFNAVYKSALTDTTYFGTVKVVAYNGTSKNLNDFGDLQTDTTSVVATGWEFYQVMCLEAGAPSYGRESGDPARADAKFIFIKHVEPGSDVTTANPGVPTVGSH